MAAKIVLIVALCVSQGFAFKPLSREQRGPCKNPVSESAETIPHEFEEAMNEMDNVRETVSAAMMESYFKGTDPKVIIACFNQQRGAYAKLGQNIAQSMREGAEELAKDLGEKAEEFAQQAAEPMRKISETLRMLPQKMWENIKNKDFVKALEVYRESRKVVEENARILAELTKKFGEEMPEVAQKAEKIAMEIRENARMGCKAIEAAFRKCVEEGGPKTEFENEDSQ